MELSIHEIQKSFGEKRVLKGISFRCGRRQSLWAAWPQRRRENDDNPHFDGCISGGQRGNTA